MQYLEIKDIRVRIDGDGRYCLNDLHRAAISQGKATKHQAPNSFMRTDQTKRLIEAMEQRYEDSRIAPFTVVKGGSDLAAQGTFVAKALVYAYAMWIDADFHLDVIEAFDQMQGAQSNQQGLWLQMQALIAKEVGSQVKASFGSHLMLQRKKEIPPLRTEREILEAAIQPSLLN